MCKNTPPQDDAQERITLRDGSTRSEKLGTGCLVGSVLGIGLLFVGGIINAITSSLLPAGAKDLSRGLLGIILWPMGYLAKLVGIGYSEDYWVGWILLVGIYWMFLGQACYWMFVGVRRMRRKGKGRPPAFPPVQ